MSRIFLNSLITSIADVIDLYSPVTSKHSRRVAVIARNIAEAMSLDNKTTDNVYFASLLHDIGSVSYNDRVDCLNFENDFVDNVSSKSKSAKISKHAEVGFYLIKELKQIKHVAEYIRYHHSTWEGGEKAKVDDRGVPLGANVIHLADMVELLLSPEKDILTQLYEVRNTVSRHQKRFQRDLFEVFMDISKADVFWLDIEHASRKDYSEKITSDEMVVNGLDDLADFSNILKRIIDFRSYFTSNHSTAVGNCSRLLADELGFNETEQQMILIAGYLHDLGKLAVPSEILNKPGPLTKYEYNIMRVHPYFTYKVLDPIGQLDTIKIWGAFHHEQMSGNGYPFRKTEDDIPLGSKIVNYIDIFVALAEERPYRSGLNIDVVTAELADKAENNAVSDFIHNAALKVIDGLQDVRQQSISDNKTKFGNFMQAISEHNSAGLK